MEHAQIIEEPLNSHPLLVRLALGLVKEGLTTVEAFEHIGSKASWRLIGHLNAISEHKSWENLRWI